MDRIPVYVMTGFLGSGKSHRLNDILAQRRYRKCLVILSEKGRTDVSTEDKIVLDASSLSDEELVEKAGASSVTTGSEKSGGNGTACVPSPTGSTLSMRRIFPA